MCIEVLIRSNLINRLFVKRDNAILDISTINIDKEMHTLVLRKKECLKCVNDILNEQGIASFNLQLAIR